MSVSSSPTKDETTLPRTTEKRTRSRLSVQTHSENKSHMGQLYTPGSCLNLHDRQSYLCVRLCICYAPKAKVEHDHWCLWPRMRYVRRTTSRTASASASRLPRHGTERRARGHLAKRDKYHRKAEQLMTLARKRQQEHHAAGHCVFHRLPLEQPEISNNPLAASVYFTNSRWSAFVPASFNP